MVSARDVTLKATTPLLVVGEEKPAGWFWAFSTSRGFRPAVGQRSRLVPAHLALSLNQALDWTHLLGCFLPNDTDYIGIGLGLESSSATNLGIS